ncbi:hypothetical protein M0G74_17850 [Microbulbifer sp. CAU 1566]|uniref:hypothetical protein n=1 Tax=Microbulbifer sp. CAU 1566 TaxID=2933269 RepID=UPI002002F93C|nr:hypothetical protein [Microbulbifer sp. CAU 1566]MCK7599142.1 hypothetical protein [Microbulbifer sp. CAU 1566]
MDNLIEIQEEIVREAMLVAVPGWRSIDINCEVFDFHGDTITSINFFCNFFIKKRVQVTNSTDLNFCLRKLSEKMSKKPNEKFSWAIADLKILRNGKYTFEFSYDPPPRITKMLQV